MRYQVLRQATDNKGRDANTFQVVPYTEASGGNLDNVITVRCYTLLSVGSCYNGVLDYTMHPPLLAIRLETNINEGNPDQHS